LSTSMQADLCQLRPREPMVLSQSDSGNPGLAPKASIPGFPNRALRMHNETSGIAVLRTVGQIRPSLGPFLGTEEFQIVNPYFDKLRDCVATAVGTESEHTNDGNRVSFV
jgi:hypothetical protein